MGVQKFGEDIRLIGSNCIKFWSAELGPECDLVHQGRGFLAACTQVLAKEDEQLRKHMENSRLNLLTSVGRG